MCAGAIPVSSETRRRTSADRESGTFGRSESTMAAVVVPSETTSAVVQRSRSTPSARVWVCAPQNGWAIPTGGVVTARLTPARSCGGMERSPKAGQACDFYGLLIVGGYRAPAPRQTTRTGFRETSPPTPLRGANIGFADIISGAEGGDTNVAIAILSMTRPHVRASRQGCHPPLSAGGVGVQVSRGATHASFTVAVL